MPVSSATIIKIPELNLLVTGLTKELRQVKVIRGLTEKRAIFEKLSYFLTWKESNFLDTGCFDKVISTHDIINSFEFQDTNVSFNQITNLKVGNWRKQYLSFILSQIKPVVAVSMEITYRFIY